MERTVANEVHQIILRGLAEAYATRESFLTECDFKYELSHRLAPQSLEGLSLVDQVQGTPTCRLHGEAKPMNGNPSKADLLICNPTRRMDFNYVPLAVIELKRVLNVAALQAEIAKFRKYHPAPDRLYVISANPLDAPLERLEHLVRGAQDVCVLARENVSVPIPQSAHSQPITSPNRMNCIIENCIRQTLDLYGKGRNQYHGFFWCNYEHEQGKKWTFPAEGDFNCHLYHRLRGSLPPSVEIRAEHHPAGLEEHLDLFVASGNPKATAAIEVKMNWDQFKPKYHNGKLCRSEADTILHKFERCSDDGHTNYLVVIQGMDAHKSDHRETALGVLSKSPVPLHLCFYNERNNESKIQDLV